MVPILAETNMVVPIGIAIAVLAIIGLVTLVAASKRHDRQDAMGMLSRETIKRDNPADFSPIGLQPTGREVEKIAALERKGAVVPTDKGEVSISEFVPPDPDSLGVARREFLNRSIVAFFGFGLSIFGVQVIAFLWPTPKGGFGSKINVGKVEDIKAKIEAGSGYYYVPEGRMWITSYPIAALDKAKAVYKQPVLNAMEAGLCCLYQKCPHLGCRVPSCVSSQWFECPCHGSQYNQVGEKKGGPAPRGMDRFATEVSGGNLTVDTGNVFQGPAVGTNTTGQEAEGPHCVGGGGH